MKMFNHLFEKTDFSEMRRNGIEDAKRRLYDAVEGDFRLRTAEGCHNRIVKLVCELRDSVSRDKSLKLIEAMFEGIALFGLAMALIGLAIALIAGMTPAEGGFLMTVAIWSLGAAGCAGATTVVSYSRERREIIPRIAEIEIIEQSLGVNLDEIVGVRRTLEDAERTIGGERIFLAAIIRSLVKGEK